MLDLSTNSPHKLCHIPCFLIFIMHLLSVAWIFSLGWVSGRAENRIGTLKTSNLNPKPQTLNVKLTPQKLNVFCPNPGKHHPQELENDTLAPMCKLVRSSLKVHCDIGGWHAAAQPLWNAGLGLGPKS